MVGVHVGYQVDLLLLVLYGVGCFGFVVVCQVGVGELQVDWVDCVVDFGDQVVGGCFVGHVEYVGEYFVVIGVFVVRVVVQGGYRGFDVGAVEVGGDYCLRVGVEQCLYQRAVDVFCCFCYYCDAFCDFYGVNVICSGVGQHYVYCCVLVWGYV